MTTLNDEQKAELELQALSLWQFYNRYYRKQMSESEFIIRYLMRKLPKEKENEESSNSD